MRLTTLLLLSALGGTLAACAPAEAPAPGTIEAWSIVPLVTIGGDESGPGSFTDVRGIVVDARQRVLVLEYTSQQIEMFDSTGRHLRTIGRKGQGPGELNDVNGLQRAPDGSLWTMDPANNRLTGYDEEGALLRTIPVNITSYGYIWEGWVEQDGTIHDPISIRIDTVRAQRLQRFRIAEGTVDTIPLPCEGLLPTRSRMDVYVFKYTGGMMSMPVPLTPMPLRQFDRRGRAWCGSTGSYTLTRVGIAGGDTITITGNRTPLPVSDADLERAKDGVRRSIGKLPVAEPDWSRIPRTNPVIERLVIDDAGRLWVQVTTPDTNQVWDVFSEDGAQVATVTSPVRFAKYLPIVIIGDRIYGVSKDADDVPVVVAARVK